MEFLRHPALIRGAQWLIAAVFVAAALPKIGDPAGFAQNIHNFRLLPVALQNLFAMTLPWVELVAGLALLSGYRRRAGAWIAAVLMVVFTIAVALAVARGLNIECGCFGTADASQVGLSKLLQNLGLVLIAVIACQRKR
jgi:uncharacterized membrane protein YphA (DoxX/SURF4 family)